MCSTCHRPRGWSWPEGSKAIADRLRTVHGWTAVVPRDGERVLL
ncbi:hypothetical protein [Amycolatopsis xylanica]|nr:hypothetical protein [Amycolatopsis xylanica]